MFILPFVSNTRSLCLKTVAVGEKCNLAINVFWLNNAVELNIRDKI